MKWRFPIGKSESVGMIKSEPKHECTPQTVIEAVLKRGVDYYDPSNLSYADQVAYKTRAKEVLNNQTFQNELRHLEADWITFAAKESPDHQATRDMRMCINAIELIIKRLEDVPEPRQPTEETDEFSPV